MKTYEVTLRHTVSLVNKSGQETPREEEGERVVRLSFFAVLRDRGAVGPCSPRDWVPGSVEKQGLFTSDMGNFQRSTCCTHLLLDLGRMYTFLASSKTMYKK